MRTRLKVSEFVHGLVNVTNLYDTRVQCVFAYVNARVELDRVSFGDLWSVSFPFVKQSKADKIMSFYGHWAVIYHYVNKHVFIFQDKLIWSKCAPRIFYCVG